jgi:AcrR family transcriptional regulator
MCARPRIATDAELLAATARAVSRVGPSRLTLADVAAEAGVVPATLVQRFGSKRGLLLALAREGSAGAGEQMGAIRAAHSSPLDALRAVADCLTGMATSPEELANHLAFLCIDLTDADFHRYTLEHARVFQGELKALLDAAVDAGELTACDTACLARLIQELLHGALVTWAIYREGTAKDWLRRDLEMLLVPYLLVSDRASKSRNRPRRGARAGRVNSRAGDPGRVESVGGSGGAVDGNR